ncbi:DMT family transporter [Wolbachia endosymbiont of Ctenocephalides felis wCfeT]|uniref:DMT family transporter n=1 Tax=Wolbachia endosymbiont of Ctenocephalides felis wCfeT TaxID=2732593 RepID=UPI001446BA73|nr:multidrug efflux SMR transporter [Wolbachia endosymbiont of Ctenocephalides felis wCfeT]
MPWLYLLLSSLIEILWAIALRFSDGFTKTMPLIVTLVSMVLSIYFLSLAVKDLPIGVCYAISSGICTVGVILIDVIALKKKMNLYQTICIVLIVVGSVGLEFLTRA